MKTKAELPPVLPILALALGFSIGLSAIACSSAAFAQRAQSADSLYRGAQTFHGKTVVLPIGIDFEGRIDHTIGSAVSRMGEKFEIEISSPILANGTEVLVPAGSRVIGEVVECIPSAKLPHMKGFPKPTGKLRVQLSGLRTPDGVTYPMVASLAGETIAQGGGGGGRRGRGMERENSHLGHGVAYVGSQNSFEAVAPGASQRFRARPGEPPKLVSPQEIMRDPIYGNGQAGQQNMGMQHVRSLIKRNFNLYIIAGSPLSIRIDAPLKIGIAPAAGSTSVLDSPMDDPERVERNGGRRFAKRGSRQQQQEAEEEQGEEVQPQPPLIPDTAPRNSFIPQTPAPQGVGGGGQYQQGGQPPATIPSGGGPDGQKTPGTDF